MRRSRRISYLTQSYETNSSPKGRGNRAGDVAAGGRLTGDEPLRYVGHPPHPSGFRPRIGVRDMLSLE